MIEAEVRHHVEEAQIKRSIERAIQKEKAHQAKLLKYGLNENDWIGVSAGTFLMGSPPDEKDRFENERQHEVQIGRFEMLKIPVTFEMFDIFCEEVRRTRPPDEGWGRDQRPVINVRYWSAVDYCHWLSKRTGANIRLPTEAEWEYACRAGTTSAFWTGATISPEQANFDGNYTYCGSEKGPSRGMTTPVNQFPPNPWGLYDMHGNVWEWCASVYDEAYSGLELKDASYADDDVRERVVRGGSWHNVPSGIRSASRNKLMPNYHYLRVGFRIVREVE
ncbi:formylglycine-generating enzyme family protein [Sedimenticola sp.]